jgi:uncharacterized membrane protein
MPIPFWMVWNTGLALVPLLLALVLFRSVRARSVGWWLGIAAFVAMLPNAPYVVTDSIHLAESVGRSDQLLLRTAVGYSVFFATGIAAYAASIALGVRALRRFGTPVAIIFGVEVVVHLASAAGVLLGRFRRWNSWDLVTRPADVLTDATWLGTPRGLAAVVFGAVCLAGTTAMLRLAARGATTTLRPA